MPRTSTWLAPPDDHRVIAIAQERLDRPVRDVHERAGRLDDIEAAGAGTGERPFGRAVRRHHNVSAWRRARRRR